MHPRLRGRCSRDEAPNGYATLGPIIRVNHPGETNESF